MMQPSLNHFQQLGFGQCSASWFGPAGVDGGRELLSSDTVCLDLEEQPSPHASDCSTDIVPCFASELEREVAELEEEARREPSWFGGAFGLAEDAYASDNTWPTDDKTAGEDLLSMDGQENSSESSGGAYPVSPVVVKAELVEESGSTLLPGAWRGCCKSAWCDRADRHRGLCNGKATVPGPAADTETGSSDVLMRDQEANVHDNNEALGGEGSSDEMEASAELDQALSGGHSRTQKNGQAEEREVASALKQGCKSASSEDADLLALNPAEAAALEFRGTPFNTLPVVRSLQPFWADAPPQRDDFGVHALHPLFPLENEEGLLQEKPGQQLLANVALVSDGQLLGASASCSVLDEACPRANRMLASSSSFTAPHGLRMAPSAANLAPPASVMVPMSLASSRPPLPPAAATTAAAAAAGATTLSPAADASNEVTVAAPEPPLVVPFKRAAPVVVVAPVLPKVRISRSVKATKAAAEAVSSPRGKKRTAGRMAANPNGHCCTQCGTQSTPVWRAGPHGPKTLCNACGVRYMKVAKRK